MARESLADRLNHLMATVPAPDGGKWTNTALVRQLALCGLTMSEAYISQLRNGKRDNPTLEALQGLAAAFVVPPAYFLDDAVTDRVNAQLADYGWLLHSEIRALAAQARGISPAGLKFLAGVIENYRTLEGLPSCVPPAQPAHSESAGREAEAVQEGLTPDRR